MTVAGQSTAARRLIIDMKGIVKRFYIGQPNELEILKGIDLQVYKGEFVSIVGASGSGKSTLMNIIGCMDVLVGVRLHSLIYAAVMGVPMIGVSYDPKVDSFLSSIERPTHFTVENFTLEGFQTVFRETMRDREAISATTAQCLDGLISKLDQNEELIRMLMEQSK